MTRFVAVFAAVALLVGGTSAFAQQKGKTATVTGEVKMISASSITIESGGKSMTFSVTPATKLLAKGSTAKTKEKQAAGAKGLSITDMVKTGNRVRVSHQGTEATEVRLM